MTPLRRTLDVDNRLPTSPEQRREVPSGVGAPASAASDEGPRPGGRGLRKGIGLCEGGHGEPESVALLEVVKPLQDAASDDAHLYPDLPSLRRAFTRVLHNPVQGSSAKGLRAGGF